MAKPIEDIFTFPKCRCFQGEAAELSSAITDAGSTALFRGFLDLCKQLNLCDIARPWFAGQCVAAMANACLPSNSPNVKDVPKMTRDEISKMNYAMVTIIDAIHEIALKRVEEIGKIYITEARA